MSPRISRPDLMPIRRARLEQLRERVQTLRDSKVGTAAEAGIRAAADKTLDVVTSRKTAENVQLALATVGQFAADVTFRFDPDAKVLFEFAQWGEEQHGRPVVVAATLQLAQDVIATVSEAGTAAIGASSVERVQHLIREWVAMVVSGGLQRTVAAEDVPERFHVILHARRSTDLVKPSSSNSGLARFENRPDPQALAYVMVALPRFLQTYLMRSLVDALPDLLSQLDMLKR
ncbi:MAG: hypothetical protein R3E66_11895 [bacterium]